MRGHIRKRAKDSWTLVLNLGRDPGTGMNIRDWIYVEDHCRALSTVAERSGYGVLTVKRCGVKMHGAVIGA